MGNYPIFMAIADHIGYDATGRPDQNDLPKILEEYKQFLRGKREFNPAFVVEKEQLEGRLDATFYFYFIQSKQKMKKSDVFLKDVAQLARETATFSKQPDKEVLYVGVPDVDQDTGEITTLNRVKGKEIRGAKVRFRGGDTLLARIEPCVYNRKTAYVPDEIKEGYGSTEFFVVRPNRERINPKYLFWILRSESVCNQIHGKVTGTTGRRRLDRKAFEKFIIPLPPREIQDKIAQIMDNAYKERKEKLAKAKELLGSIESYILNQLSIKPPKVEEKKRFVVDFKNTRGGRFDVFYHQPKYERAEKSLHESTSRIVKLGTLIDTINYGASIKSYPEGEIPFLRIQNLQQGKIDLNEIHYAKKSELTQSDYVRKSDFLISRSGTVGMVARIDEETDGFGFGSFMIRFNLKIDKEVNPDFLCNFLNSQLGRLQSTRFITGAVQGNITISAIKNIQIPLPSLETQNQIAKEVKRRQKEAEYLRQEAENIVWQAKQEVEKIILGEDLC